MQNFMHFRSRAVSLPDERRKINEKYDLAGNSVELQLKCVQVKTFINGSCKRDHCHCCRHMIHDPSLFYPGLDQISGKPLSICFVQSYASYCIIIHFLFQAHIEDLLQVNERVKKFESTEFYCEANPTSKNREL